MINPRIRDSTSVVVCEREWTDSASSYSSSSSFCNKSEPVLRYPREEFPRKQSSESLEQDLVFEELGEEQSEEQDLSYLSENTWQNPSQADDVMSSQADDAMSASSSSSLESSDSWDETDIRMYPEGGARVISPRGGHRAKREPTSSSSLEGIPDNELTAGSSIDRTKWLEEQLTRDLGNIHVPSFDFTHTSNLFSDQPLFSPSSSSETTSQKISYGSFDRSESGGSGEVKTYRYPRHSWAGNLDIIDSDSNTLEYYSASHVSKRRRNSFDRTFSIKKRPAARPAAEKEDVNLKFASQCCVFDQMKSRVPGLKQLLRTKTLSTDLILEKQRVVIKFTQEKEYLCSSIKSQKKKVVLHLLDIKNILVLTDSNTLIIQFKESSKSRQIQDKSTIDKLSGTMRSSKSNSLNRSIYSDSDSELTEIKVGTFNNCQDLARLILKRRESLVPRSILKRGSFRVKTIEPIVVRPPQLPDSPELIEFVTYV